MASLSFKENYRCFPSLQQCYTGGPFVVSSDGFFIACACNESIKIVDSSNASVRSTIESYSEAVTALTLSPDDKLLFSASHSRQIRVWDLSTWKCVGSWKGHEGLVVGWRAIHLRDCWPQQEQIGKSLFGMLMVVSALIILRVTKGLFLVFFSILI